MAIWFSIVMIISVFLIYGVPAFQRGDDFSEINQKQSPHFSVRWMGFTPSYSNSTPDYYICINNLKDASLNMQIALQIGNYENTSFYFLIDKYAEPLPSWTVDVQYLGFIDIEDPVQTFTYEKINRTKPTEIAEGILHEDVELVVEAYYDGSYTQLYSQANFTVKFHFIDLTSTAWTLISHDNFDDGTLQGWGTSCEVHWWVKYRSWPCSLRSLRGYPVKTFDVGESYTEAYLVAAAYPPTTWIPQILFDNELTFKGDVEVSGETWYQFAIPLPLGKQTSVKIKLPAFDGYLDDVYVIAK